MRGKTATCNPDIWYYYYHHDEGSFGYDCAGGRTQVESGCLVSCLEIMSTISIRLPESIHQHAKHLAKRDAKADIASILAKVPDTPPAPEDRL